MYSIEFTELAEKQFLKLQKNIQVRIKNTINRIRIRPYHHVKRLIGVPYFSFRVGDYRLILDIQNDKLIILVLEIGHRKNIYKKLG